VLIIEMTYTGLDCDSGPHLVVVPLSVLANWLSEFERFCPSMRCVRFHGPKVERNRIKSDELNDVREFDVVITTYEMLQSEVNYFRRRFQWRVVIVDEGHRIKNEKSQLAGALRRIPSIFRLLLTGTPLQVDVSDSTESLVHNHSLLLACTYTSPPHPFHLPEQPPRALGIDPLPSSRCLPGLDSRGV